MDDKILEQYKIKNAKRKERDETTYILEISKSIHEEAKTIAFLKKISLKEYYLNAISKATLHNITKKAEKNNE